MKEAATKIAALGINIEVDRAIAFDHYIPITIELQKNKNFRTLRYLFLRSLL